MMASVGQQKQGGGDTCCSYKTDGMGTKGYDCIIIPGAVKTDLTPIGVKDKALNANMFCGQSKGLGTEKDKDTAATICSKTVPFSLQFISDQIESEEEGKADPVPDSSGFKLAFIMS